jgi:hypothetical protein
MHEICRQYIERKEHKFLIIIFAHEKKEQARIFLHRQLIYQQVVRSADDQRNKTIAECKKWIETNYG